MCVIGVASGGLAGAFYCNNPKKTPPPYTATFNPINPLSNQRYPSPPSGSYLNWKILLHVYTSVHGPLFGRDGRHTPKCFSTRRACASKQPPHRMTFQLGSSMMVLPICISLT